MRGKLVPVFCSSILILSWNSSCWYLNPSLLLHSPLAIPICGKFKLIPVYYRFIQHLQYAGFSKEKEVSFPHKQAWFGRLRRECWNGPSF